VALAVLGVLSTMTVQLMDNWGIPSERLQNGTNATAVIRDLDIFNDESSIIMNSSQYAPGQSDSETPDSVSSITSQSSIMTSSFTSVIKFSAQAITLPKTIILAIGNYIGVPPQFLITLSIFFTLTIIFLLVGAVFFNKF
jgi:hypothetical protein